MMDNCLVTEPAAFRARTVKVNVPASVGVPVIVPVAVLRVKPPGKAPTVMLHVIGAVPVAVSVSVYAVPTVPWSSVCAGIVGATTGAAIVMDSCLVTLPKLFWARTVKLNVPAAVGVPVIAPVVAFSVKPPGSAPAAMLNVSGIAPL